MKRLIAVTAAFVAGWLAYMIAMVLTVYDGVLSLLFQPFVAALASGLFVGAALLAGLLLRVPGARSIWASNRWIAGLLALGSILLLCFGYSLGLRETQVDPETGRTLVVLDGRVALGGYFMMIFAIANWPVRRRSTTDAAE